MEAKASHRFYRGCYRFARAVLSVVFRIDIKGKENIPSGAAMICSNHSNLIDPIFIAFAFGIKCFLHFIAKVELFNIPVLSAVVIKLGAIKVDREKMGAETIKSTLKYFRNDEKVAIFPEGTRTRDPDAISAKFGAVKIAERAGVPIVPVYVPRRKRLFSKITVVIGKPYNIDRQSHKRSPEDYASLSADLMNRIEALDSGNMR